MARPDCFPLLIQVEVVAQSLWIVLFQLVHVLPIEHPFPNCLNILNLA